MNKLTKEEAIQILKDDVMVQSGWANQLSGFSRDIADGRIEAHKMGIEALENQKTGHWIRITKGAIREKYTCSECGRQIEDCEIENLLRIKYPYCHCGAKMEGE